ARVGCFDVGLLRPRRAGASEDVDRPGLRNRVIVLIPVYAFGSAGFTRSRNSERVAVLAQRHNKAEPVALPRIRRLDIRLLSPRVISSNEDVDGTRGIERIVVLVSVDPLCTAAFIRSAHNQRGSVAAEGDAVSFKSAAIAEMTAHFRV